MIESPSARRRLLGVALRGYRQNLGYALEDAAAVLECDRSKISRIETGQRGIRPKELRELLTEYGVAEQEGAALVAIAQARGTGAWWRKCGVFDDATVERFQLEMAATQIQVYESRQIPALLRTVQYATAVADADPDPMRPGTSTLAAVTVARQHAVLKERQLSLAVVIDEAVLHRMVGGPEVMRAQLDHLAAVADDTMGITIQVLPFASGEPATAIGGSATIMRFADAPGVGVVYLPRLGHDACLVEQAEVARYAAAFTELTRAALTPAESARLFRAAPS